MQDRHLAMADMFVVDTDSDTRLELKLVAQACGYSVRSFSDGVQAQNAMRGTRPRLLVTELLLRGQDGFELCQSVRTQLGYADLPILCISCIAWGSVDLPLLLKRRFGARFLGKGCLARDFIRVVQEMIGEPSPIASLPAGVTQTRAETESRLLKPLGIKDKERIEGLIRQFEQQISVESGFARRDVRVEQEFVVQFQNVDELVSEFTHNISAGGLFIHSTMLPALDESIQIRLKIPYFDKTLDIQGRVVHHVSVEQAQEADIPAGFGVEFVDVSPVHRKALNDLTDALRKHAEEEPQRDAIVDPGKERPAEALLWIALIGFPMKALLKVPSFVRRQQVEMVEFADLPSAVDFLAVHRLEAVIVGESALQDQDPEALLGELGRWISSSTERILVAVLTKEFQTLVERKLCHAVLDASLPADRILDELSSRLGLRIRQSPRVSCRTDVRVTLPGNEFSASMINVSGGGMLIRTSAQVEEGEIVNLEFDLPQSPRVCCRAQVMRCTANSGAKEKMIGVAFIELSDDTFLTIRRFVQANVNFRDFFGWIKKSYFD